VIRGGSWKLTFSCALPDCHRAVHVGFPTSTQPCACSQALYQSDYTCLHCSRFFPCVALTWHCRASLAFAGQLKMPARCGCHFLRRHIWYVLVRIPWWPPLVLTPWIELIGRVSQRMSCPSRTLFLSCERRRPCTSLRPFATAPALSQSGLRCRCPQSNRSARMVSVLRVASVLCPQSRQRFGAWALGGWWASSSRVRPRHLPFVSRAPHSVAYKPYPVTGSAAAVLLLCLSVESRCSPSWAISYAPAATPSSVQVRGWSCAWRYDVPGRSRTCVECESKSFECLRFKDGCLSDCAAA